MDASEQSALQKVLGILPYRKWWFWLLALLAVRMCMIAYENNRPVIYDHVALGFPDEASMNQAFAKGYHTRQKLDEMTRSGDAKAVTGSY